MQSQEQAQQSYHGDSTRNHQFWNNYSTNQPENFMKWDFKDPPSLVCSNHEVTAQDAYRCKGHANGDYLIPAYHGDASRNHSFWVYDDQSRIENSSWDYASLPCDNPVFMDRYDGKNEFRCLGHHLTYHGDPTRECKFWEV